MSASSAGTACILARTVGSFAHLFLLIYIYIFLCTQKAGKLGTRRVDGRGCFKEFFGHACNVLRLCYSGIRSTHCFFLARRTFLKSKILRQTTFHSSFSSSYWNRTADICGIRIRKHHWKIKSGTKGLSLESPSLS